MKNLLLFVATLLFSALMMEWMARSSIEYDISYYGGTEVPGGHRYPFGYIYINSDGFPDKDEFIIDHSRDRIGYFGDSVTYGTGAGAGYRYHDLLQKIDSKKSDHWAFGVVGEGITKETSEDVLRLVHQFAIDKIVYGMNLNDIAEDGAITSELSKDAIQSDDYMGHIWIWWRQHVDFLLSYSAFYHVLRRGAAVIAFQLGFDRVREEHFPNKYAQAIKDTANRVNMLGRELHSRRQEFCVIVFPYEMQVSSSAAQFYRDAGVRWEEGFLEGSTQKKVIDMLDSGIEVVDASQAFFEDGLSVEQNQLGQYFVFDHDVAIDWNHPNREGHRIIANFLRRHEFCGLASAAQG